MLLAFYTLMYRINDTSLKRPASFRNGLILCYGFRLQTISENLAAERRPISGSSCSISSTMKLVVTWSLGRTKRPANSNLLTKKKWLEDGDRSNTGLGWTTTNSVGRCGTITTRTSSKRSVGRHAWILHFRRCLKCLRHLFTQKDLHISEWKHWGTRTPNDDPKTRVHPSAEHSLLCKPWVQYCYGLTELLPLLGQRTETSLQVCQWTFQAKTTRESSGTGNPTSRRNKERRKPWRNFEETISVGGDIAPTLFGPRLPHFCSTSGKPSPDSLPIQLPIFHAFCYAVRIQTAHCYELFVKPFGWRREDILFRTLDGLVQYS